MRRLCLLVCSLWIVILFAGAGFAVEVIPTAVVDTERPAVRCGEVLAPNELNELDEDTTIFFDDFEGDINWEAHDYTTTPAKWHIDDWNAYGQLNSWWCGEEREVSGETIYGYDNAWLQFLETPALDLTSADGASLELDFMMQWGTEDGIPQNENYDGWDGCTVFYSMDGGDTWEVLPDPSVAYNATSLYSFGGTHALGPGIAGWRDVSDGWENCTYSLTDLAGEADVRFRFAFASDAGVNTVGHPEWFGFMVDDITVVDDDSDYLTNDADGTAEPEEFSPLDQIGADVTFELQEEEYSSPTHAYWCDSGHDLFAVLISPEVELIEGWRHFVQYQVYCDFPDSDGDEDNTLEDYYQIEISNDGGSHWERLGYDYGYNGSESGWVLRDSMLNNEAMSVPIEIPIAYAGDTVQFRFRAITDDNDDGGVGSGLFIDDFEVIANSGFDHDVGVEQVFIGWPTTAGERIESWVDIRNYGNNDETFNALWRVGPQPYPLLNNFFLASGDSTVEWLTTDDGDGWLQEQPGDFTVLVQTLLTDDFMDNNSSPEIPVTVRPAGTYEYGYDDRLPSRTTFAYETGEGPATYFNSFDFQDGTASFMIDGVNVLWNGDLEDGETADVELHIYADNEGAPDDELYSGTFTVEQGIINPNWHEIDLSSEDLVIAEPVWIWFELVETGAQPKPHIVFSPADLYPDNHFGFDGATLVDPQGDYMIRIVGGYTYDTNEMATGVLPQQFALHAAYPNPFNPESRLSFDLPQRTVVKLSVFDLLGREVTTLVDGNLSAGRHQVSFDGANLASGLYFARMEAEGRVFTQKLMLVK